MIPAIQTVTPITLPALAVQPVTEDVPAIVGETGQRSPEKLASSAPLVPVVTDGDAVLIDPGGSWKCAEAPHEAIRTTTGPPVVHVINMEWK